MRPSLVTSRLSWRERNADLIAIKSEPSISGRLRVGSTRRGHSRPVLLVQACPDASADWQDVARFVGEHSAIVPELTGAASITGDHTFVVEPGDVLSEGFRL